MPTFANTINGNEILAKRSQCDYGGNDIQQTYATKSEVTTDLSSKQDTISDLATIRSGAQAGATAVQPGDLATVATTGDYDDLVDKPDLSIYAESSNLATVATTGSYDDLVDKPTIPAAQINSDWTSNSGVSQILNKPTLSTVATTGDYDDLVNKPSIPAAQINSDWSETDPTSKAYIQNKPTIPSGSDLVPPYTLPTDEGKVLTVGPSTTYWSTPAAGGVTDVEVDGTSVVSGGVASITMPTVDQTYDGTSTNAQSGTAIAGEIAKLAQVPAVTSSDDGKVLTADYTGGVASYSWETPSSNWPGLFEATYNVTTYADIVQAISEKKVVYCRISSGASRMAFLAYIGTSNVEFQYYRSVSSKSATNQGDEIYVYTVSSSGWTTTTRNTYTRITAGTNMSQSYSSGVLTLSADDQLPAATSSDEGKVLTVDSNGDPQWVTGGGGGGVQSDWTEADPTSMAYIENKPTPKTLTAGDGIIVTESSNAITVSSGYNETVLYYNANGENLKNGITLSESRQNFEIIRIIMSLQANHSVGYVDIPMYGINTGTTFTIQPSIPFDEASVGFVLNWKIFITATDTSLTSTNAIYWGKSSCDGTSTNPGTWTQGANINVPYVYKVIGINRVAND